MTLSKNGAALALLVLSWLGFEFTEDQIIQVVAAFGHIVSFLVMAWNQWDRKDTWGFFFKKK